MKSALHWPVAARHPAHRNKVGGIAVAWVSLGVALLVGLAQLPAHWVAVALNHLTQGRVMLVEARGTLWNGSAFMALGAGVGSGSVHAWQQRLQWHMAPSGLNEFTLKLSDATSSAKAPWVWQLRWLPTGWQVHAGAVDWRLPSQWLIGLGTPWNTIEPQGQVHISSPGWLWQQSGRSWQSQGRFTLTLLDFATRLSSLKPLGDYELSIEATPETRVMLKTLQGPLQLVGHGVWHDGKLQFEGEAWALQTQDEPVLSNLLGVLGTRNGQRSLLKVG